MKKAGAAAEVGEGSIRLTGGVHRGARLFSPPGLGTRPALAKVRGAIFNMLGEVEGLEVLDVFAGTGALGFEALSRGASRATFVERDPACLEAMKRSAEKLRLGDRARIVAGDAYSAAAEVRGASIVFVDPPYALVDEATERPRFVSFLSRLAADGVLRPGGWMLVETRDRAKLGEVPGLRVDDRRTWGQTAVWFLRVHSRT
jgi:16S rRNA (guanine966-N2)-methyltransferase